MKKNENPNYTNSNTCVYKVNMNPGYYLPSPITLKTWQSGSRNSILVIPLPSPQMWAPPVKLCITRATLITEKQKQVVSAQDGGSTIIRFLLDINWTYIMCLHVVSYLKRCFAQTIQCIGSEGVFLMVQPGKVFWVGLGWHS